MRARSRRCCLWRPSPGGDQGGVSERKHAFVVGVEEDIAVAVGSQPRHGVRDDLVRLRLCPSDQPIHCGRGAPVEAPHQHDQADPNPFFPSDLRVLCTTNVAFLRRPRRFLGNTGTSLRFSDSVASPLASAFSAPGGGRDEAPHTLWLRPSSCDVASPLTSAFSAACGCRDESPHTLWSRPWPASERQIR